MVSGSKRLLNGMSSKNISGVCHLNVPIALKRGTILNLVEHSVYVQARTGIVLPFFHYSRNTLFVVIMRIFNPNNTNINKFPDIYCVL
jgi:hypothetical protein